MAHPDQVLHSMKTLSAVERKEYEELKTYHSEVSRRKRERTVFLGYCVIGILSMLTMMGLLNFEQVWRLWR